jgi:hypothetical protein
MIGRLGSTFDPTAGVGDHDAVAPGFGDLLTEEQVIAAMPTALPPMVLERRPAETPPPAPPPREQPDEAEAPAGAPSHVHLVLDDEGERLVVTVAVRGNDVHVALRMGDQSATAAVRNAHALDNALRNSGLDLVELEVASDEEEENP